MSLNSNIHNTSLWLLDVPPCSPANRKVKFVKFDSKLKDALRRRGGSAEPGDDPPRVCYFTQEVEPLLM